MGLSDEYRTLAARADVIVNTTPLTPETRGMFDAKFFEGAKAGAFFINIGRGESVVTDGLVAALKSGHLGGAGLDVTDPEPLPAGHPLWSMPNVIITPNIGGRSDRFVEQTLTVLEPNLAAYKEGRLKDLRNIIAH